MRVFQAIKGLKSETKSMHPTVDGLPGADNTELKM